MTANVGPARDRVDGLDKVTGAATYAVEFDVPHCAYAWTVESTIAKGRVTAIDPRAALAAPGVLAVLTHENAPKLAKPNQNEAPPTRRGIRNEERNPLSDATVHYAGQYLAAVVAQSIEQARHAASLVRVNYATEGPVVLTLDAAGDSAERPAENNGEAVQIASGDVAPALTDPELVRIEQTYVTPTETHNPIEMSGTIAAWDGDRADGLRMQPSSSKACEHVVAASFGLKDDDVRVISPFVGGAFGCKGAVWPHVLLAAMAAKVARVPVKLHVPRQSMFTSTGHRTPTRQTMTFAASRDGKLRAMQHVTETHTSTVGTYVESCGARSTAMLYASPAIRIDETIHRADVGTPTFMRRRANAPARSRWSARWTNSRTRSPSIRCGCA